MSVNFNSALKLNTNTSSGELFSFIGTICQWASKAISTKDLKTSLKSHDIILSSHSTNWSYLLAHVLCEEHHKTVAEKEIIRKIDQLGWLHEEAEEYSKEEGTSSFLDEIWQQVLSSVDPDLMSLLSEGIHYAQKKNSQNNHDLTKQCLEQNPSLLLRVVTPEGNNLIKQLILELEQLGQSKKCASFWNGEIFLNEKLKLEISIGMKKWGNELQLHEKPAEQQPMKSLISSMFSLIHKSLQNLGLNESEKIQLVLSLIDKRTPELLIVFLNSLNLSKEGRIALAHALIEKKQYFTLISNIDKFYLPKEIQIELSKICIENDPLKVAKASNRIFLCTSLKEHLVHVLIEKKEIKLLFLILDRLNPTNELLPDIFNKFIEEGLFTIAKHKISENSRFNLVIYLAKKDQQYLLCNLNKFNLSLKERLKLVEFCLEENELYALDSLQYFNLDEQHLVQLGYFLAKKNPLRLAEFIKNISIKEEHIRLEFALEFVKDQRNTTLYAVDNLVGFKLNEQNLSKVINVLAKKLNNYEFQIIPQILRCHNVNREVRFTLACNYFSDSSSKVDELPLFELDEKQRLEVLHRYSKHSLHTLGTCVQKFKVSDQSFLKKLMWEYISYLKDRLPNVDDNDLGNLANFRVKNSKDQIAVIEDYFRDLPPDIRLKIYSKCHFDEQASEEILKMFIPICPEKIPTYVSGFEFGSEKKRTELAMSCAEHFAKLSQDISPIPNIDLVDQLHLTSISDRLSIIKQCNPKIDWEFVKQYKSFSRHRGALSEVLKIAHDNTFKVQFNEVFEGIFNLQTPGQRETHALWLFEAFTLFINDLSEEQIIWIKKEDFLRKILGLNNPELCLALVQILIALVKKNILQSFAFAPKDPRENSLSDKKDLLQLIFIYLQEEGIDIPILRAFQKQVNSRDLLSNTFHFRTVMQALIPFAENKDLSPKEKSCVIRQLSNDAMLKFTSKKGKVKEIFNHITLLSSLHALVALMGFKDYASLRSVKDNLFKLLSQTFKTHLPIGDLSDFSKKYEQTLGSSRSTQGIMVFAGKMSKKGEKHLNSFATFVKSIINGDFPKVRYETQNNQHLQKIAPEFLRKWQMALKPINVGDIDGKKEMSSLSTSVYAIDTDDPHHLFNCGKDIDSCVRWDGDNYYCCGLLGYLLHGQTRLLAVVDEKIESRAILHLALDENEKPVLLLEKPYPALISPSHLKALYDLAKEKADFLGAPLLSKGWKTNGDPYPTKLIFHKGSEPAEYFDSAPGVMENGECIISDAHYLIPSF